MKSAILFALSMICFGCAPIDRAAVLNKSLAKKATTLSRFGKYPGVEDEQSQIKEASSQLSRDIGLVKDCLKHRGGIANPICRADYKETEFRVGWITASSTRAEGDIDKNPAANEKAKRKARKTFSEIQGNAKRTMATLDQGGLLVKRFSTVHMQLPEGQ